MDDSGLPPLRPVLTTGPGDSPVSRTAFMTSIVDWATTTAPLRAAEIEDLPEIPRQIRVLYWFWNDASVEGVWYFISESWGARFWAELREISAAIRAKETLACLGAVEALFPRGFPTTEAEMQAVMRDFDNRDPDPLRALSRTFRDPVNEEIPRCLHEYLLRHVTQVEEAHRI